MPALARDAAVAVMGAGAMGAGIAQVAAQAGHRVLLYDARTGAVGGREAQARRDARRRSLPRAACTADDAEADRGAHRAGAHARGRA